MTTAVLSNMKSAAAQTYRESVILAADGERPDDLISTLTISGKSLAEFEADVSRLTERRQAAEQLAELPSLNEQAGELRREASAKHAKLEEERREFERQCEPREREIIDLRSRGRNLSEKARRQEQFSRNVLERTADPTIAKQIEREKAAITNWRRKRGDTPASSEEVDEAIRQHEANIARLEAERLRPDSFLDS